MYARTCVCTDAYVWTTSALREGGESYQDRASSDPHDVNNILHFPTAGIYACNYDMLERKVDAQAVLSSYSEA